MELDFFDLARSYESKMGLSLPDIKSVVVITNSTGNQFTVSIPELLTALEDLYERNEEFLSAGEQYNETKWREVSRRLFRSEVVKTLAGTQTKPLFSTLSKLISAGTRVSGKGFDENRLNLDKEAIKATLLAFSESTASSSGRSTRVAADRVKGRAAKGENLLVYGAPGTGKSRFANDDALAQTAGKRDLVFRTVFHGDTMQGDFVGTIRPMLNGTSVAYGFAPGPFARALKAAIDNPKEHVVLIIEELNRANAAAAFGEVFQLLDRDEDGASCYEVHPESEELASYVYGANQGDQDASRSTIYIPSNLTLIATMNSADQGVKSIDMAFRRRWKALYQTLNVKLAPNIGVYLDSGLQMPWPTFLQALNEFLITEFATEEDRLVGQYFASAGDLEGGRVPDKLLLYLWDDLLRGEDRSMLFSGDIKTYAQLQARTLRQEDYFSDGFLAKAFQRKQQG